MLHHTLYVESVLNVVYVLFRNQVLSSNTFFNIWKVQFLNLNLSVVLGLQMVKKV